MNQNQDNVGNAGLPLVPVRFEFTHPTTASVSVAGTFNSWHPTTKSMHPMGNGRWLKEMFLAPGTYEYCLVVDDRWMPDPLAKSSVPNPFGGRNSILKVGGSPQPTHPADAENSPLKNTNQQKTRNV